jgi:hypothetical protein
MTDSVVTSYRDTEPEPDAMASVPGEVGLNASPVAKNGRGGVVGPVLLDDGDDPGNESHQQGPPDADEEAPQPPVLASLLPHPLLEGAGLVLFVRDAGLEERSLGVGEVGVGRGAPVERGLESGAAVQLAVGTAHGVPTDGGRGEMAQEALPFLVLVEPRAQPRPFPHQRFMGDFEPGVPGDEEAGAHEGVDDPAMRIVRHDGGRVEALADGFTVVGRRDQSQEQ